MGKIRVYELAKELNVENKKMMEYLQKQGFNIKNHMNIMDENAENSARRYFGKAEDPAGFKPTVKRIKKEVVEAERALREKQQAAEEALKAEQNAAGAADNKAVKEDSKENKETVKEPITETKSETKTEEKKEAKTEAKTEAKKEEPREEKPKAAEVSPAAAKAEAKPETKAASKPQATSELKSEIKAEAKPEVKPEAASDVKADTKAESKPEAKAADKPAETRERNPRGDNAKASVRSQSDQKPARNKDNRQHEGRNVGQGNHDSRKPDNKRSDGQQNRQDNRGRSQRQEAAVVYTSPQAPSKQDSRRPDKKRSSGHQKDQDFGREQLNRFEKSGKNKPRNKYKEQRKQKVEIAPATPKKVVIGETIILSELAKSMHKTASELIKKLFEMGTMATINQSLDSDTAILLADEFGVEVEVRQEKIVEILEDDKDNPRDLKERPPVVTVMGHVDHGKTSLLDAIRNTRVTSTEAGGITQHIGAYQVEIQNKKITFLDTPGHEAFTAMRARGAQVTDISVLVVAADDGIMPQTVEAINHSKAAGVPIIVAINKIDKPGANVDKVMQELTEYELVPEAWGGDVIMVPVSAKKGQNIETLLEMILLVAEMAELKANPKRQARGTVIEAKLDRNRGPLATLLIQKGTLKVGETIIAGSVFGKVRAMNDDNGHVVRSAGPSTPVEILGFSEVPEAGETFIAIKDERDARYAAQIQAINKREEEMRKSAKVSLDDLFSKIAEGEVKDLNIIIKADVRGSVEALSQSLEKLSTDEVKVSIIHVGVGAINESDVMLADASNAIIIGFNVRPDAQTRKAAEAAMVDMRLYSVIYDAIEDVKQAMVGLLAPVLKETWQGQVEVRNTFKVPKIGLVAGGYVLEGKITRNSEVRIIRDGVVIFQGKLASLKRFKDDVKEVVQGFECGIGIENYNDLKEGDVIEAFVMEETTREL